MKAREGSNLVDYLCYRANFELSMVDISSISMDGVEYDTILHDRAPDMTKIRSLKTLDRLLWGLDLLCMTLDRVR